ncbi:hypothetical protein QBD00_002021 [Ochrobactrum sp. AN78]|nr:hypothetical protein [Ochrobactrum sp. AN78]
MIKSNRKFARKLPVQETTCARDVAQVDLFVLAGITSRDQHGVHQ